MQPAAAEKIALSPTCSLYHYAPVAEFQHIDFEALWALHPTDFHTIKIMGKDVLTPRWQQSYGKNYRYTGSQNNALPIPDILQPFLAWSQQHIDSRLNGLLLNWYDGEKGHYIGAHRDDERDLQSDSPILTISMGEERIFRLRPYGGEGYRDFTFSHAEAIVLPADTNRHFTHEVPHFKRYTQRRISITLRAYS